MAVNRSQHIFSGKLVNLAVYEIRLPDGSIGTRELIEHPGAAAVVALDNQQQVLMVRQFRLGANRDLYEIPAGLIEPGELPEACAVRELREEVGYQPASLEALGGYYTAAGYTTEYIHLYLARDLTYAPLQQDRGEFAQGLKMPLAQAVQMAEQGDIIDGKTIIALLKVARRLGL